MATKEKHSGDRISEQTLHEILLDIKYRLNHMEDMEADNRTLIVKLIKQSNSIVQFLSKIDVEVQDVNYEEMMGIPKIDDNSTVNSNRAKHIKELVNEYMDKANDLKEFEEELKKHKDEVTPGQVGET